MSILIIGNGNRVLHTIVPALNISKENIYLYGRNPEKVSVLCEDHNLFHHKDLTTLPADLKKIFICLPASITLSYLKILQNFNTKDIDLFIDTPILGPLSNINILRYAKYFNSHHTTEDWLSKPFFRAALELQKKYNFGNLKKIRFQNSGFSYHSLAVSRFFLFQKPLIKVSRKVNNDGVVSDLYQFLGAQMEIVGPKNYDDCKTILFFENGCIVDNLNSAILEPGKACKETIIFYRSFDSKNIHNYFYDFPAKKVFKSKLQITLKLPLLIEQHYENQEKVISLVSKIASNERQYDLFEGAYDSLVLALYNKFNTFYDIPLFKSSILKIALKLYGKL
ncbi:hypothetical protein OAP37_00765 [Gammaproteobacteria bacterium]|jgi:hypothetical protein|nr:hypothetical protein [Gammaproteobacteria bacterium]